MKRRVGVAPEDAFVRRAHLFGVLETIFPVHFEPRAPGSWRDLDALIACPGNTEPLPPELPALEAQAEPGGGESGQEEALRLSDSQALDRRLRGAVLTESWVPLAEGDLLRGEALAVAGDRPVWSLDAGGRQHRVALAPEPLQEGFPLLSLLQPGRFLSLLPLIHFLRRVAPSPWRAPAIQAAFLFDDPNLHWRTYGHVDYRRLADQSRAAGFHVAFATVPLDGWLVHPPTARLFREASGQLSLVFHGNEHTRHELGRIDSVREGVGLVRRAVRRVERFERRAGVRVARIMAPPHARYSPAAVEALHREGFEALTASEPHPTTEPLTPVPPLTGWNPLELLDGGFPVLPRIHLDDVGELAPLRAFLDQPLVIYGHHADLAGQPNRLPDVAAAIDRLGVSNWARLDAITRDAVSTRMDDATFLIRPFARRVNVAVPREAERVQVEMPGNERPVLTRRAAEDDRGWRAGAILEDPHLGGERLEILLEPPVSPAAPPASPGRLSPARRALTEARDRAQALVPLPRRVRG